MNEVKNLVRMKGASATQHTNKGKKGDWTINASSGEKISSLPFDMNEQHVMKAIHLAREAELEAFNIGINFGKSATQATIRRLEQKNIALANENIKLSETLNRLLIKGVEQDV